MQKKVKRSFNESVRQKISNVGKKSISVSLWLQPVFKQKVYYIHSNPVVAGFVNCLKNTNIPLHLFILRQILNGLF